MMLLPALLSFRSGAQVQHNGMTRAAGSQHHHPRICN
ncbi:protein of unknown function [Paraburkholderia kururiensis]